ncbi:MAG: discoidin domain-containing protein [Collinsella sp.]|nr:discoidin domain-containing protein [Collinsella sp.]
MTVSSRPDATSDPRIAPAPSDPASPKRLLGAAALAVGLATATSGIAVPALLCTPTSAYADTVSPVRPLAELDEQIRQLGDPSELARKASSGNLTDAEERLVLLRELTARAGAEKLEAFRGESERNREFLDWFMGDLAALRYYITGGEAWTNNRSGKATEADYITSLGVLARLRAAHLADLADGADADVHLRMMVACSLDVSGRARLWTGDPGFVSDHLVRYETIKTFRTHHETYRFQKDLFDALPVESMRWVFENQITDAELPWLANYSLSRYPQLEQEDSRLNAYSYIWYTGDYTSNNGYSYAGFYDDAQFNGPVTELKPTAGSGKPATTWQGGWKEKYRLAYDDPNFPNADAGDPFHIGCGDISQAPGATTDKTKYHRLWMVFEKGGVCGALAKTFSNLNGMVGVPSVVVGQPGHAATLTYELREDANGTMVPTYRIQNDVSGWGKTKSPSAAHWLCGWGRGMAHDSAGAYALYAQEALSDWGGYVRSYETHLVAASFEGDAAVREELVGAALAAQPLNFDAYKAKIDLMSARGASASEWEGLAKDIAQALRHYPLPMHDLIKYMEKTGGKEHLVALEAVRLDALQKATKVTKEQTVNWDACVRVAKNLMGEKDGTVATFSFDGEQAGKIRLGEHLQGGGVAWKYSLDGGSTWVELTDGQTEAVLSDDQIASISAETDILIQLIGASTANCIDIAQGKAEALSCEANDRANRIYFFDGKVPAGLEMRADGGAWEPLDATRAYPGDHTVEIRTPATGLTTASDPLTFTFTASERDASLVPYEEMNVNSYSSSRDGKAMADRVIDGYYGKGNMYWVTNRESAPDAWIVLDLGRERLVSSIDYWRPKNLMAANGIPRWEKMTYTISAAPDTGLAAGEAVGASAFSVVGSYGKNAQKVPAWTDEELTATFSFDTPVRARYLKFHLTDIYHCAVLFDVYEVHEPGLESQPIAFDSLKSGYADDERPTLPLDLSNTSKATAVIEDVTIEGDGFVIEGEGSREIAAGSRDASWTVRPAAGLAAGSYSADATVTYRGAEGQQSRTLRIPLSIDVAPRGASVAIAAEKIDDTSVRLSAQVNGAEGLEGAVEYALCEEQVAPGALTAAADSADGEQVQGNPLNAWTTDPAFTNLTPGRTYYAFARVTGLPGLDPVVCEEPLAVEIAADSQEGGDGEQGQGGEQGGDGEQGDNGSGNDSSGDQGNGSGNDGNGSGDDGDQGGNQSGDDQDGDGKGDDQNDQDDNRAPDDNRSNDSSEGLPATGDASAAGPLSAIVLGVGSLLTGAIRRLRRP